MRGPVFTSAIAHGVIVAIVYFGLPKWFEPDEPEETPIVVELVEIADQTIAQAPTPIADAPKPVTEPPAPQQPAPQAAPPPPPAPQPEPTPPAPVPEPEPPPPQPTPAPQVAMLEPPPTPVVRPTPPPPPAPVVAAPPKPKTKPDAPKVVATPKPKAKPDAPKQAPAFDPTAMAALLDRTRQPTPAPTPTPAPKQATPTPAQAQAAAPPPVISPTPTPARDVPLAISAIDAFRAQVEKCWLIPAGARDAQNLRVTLRLFMTQDGNLLRPPEVLDGARMKRAGEETFRAAAESAVRAVQRCAPYRMLPVQKYDTWREIELTFDPSKVLG